MDRPDHAQLIEQALERIAAARVLILLASRPDQQPPLAAHPHVTRLTLNRLGRAGIEEMVARLGGDRLPVETINAIIARTDGVPLFVEELTKAVLETGETAIPASLHDSLMARLDRIPEVKEVAQMAACIGREFDYALLAAVADRTEPSLQSALDRLTATELVFRRGMPPEASYSFKHALVRDAAYESLVKRRRQQLHARIAQYLEKQASNVVETQLEIIAHHFTCADLHESASDYWLRAGVRNASRSAYVEATSHLTMALQTASGVADPLLRQEKELEIRTLLASALRVTRGSCREGGGNWRRGFASMVVGIRRRGQGRWVGARGFASRRPGAW